jgi:hypothetical protein
MTTKEMGIPGRMKEDLQTRADAKVGEEMGAAKLKRSSWHGLAYELMIRTLHVVRLTAWSSSPNPMIGLARAH